jgi:hypothetical protein
MTSAEDGAENGGADNNGTNTTNNCSNNNGAGNDSIAKVVTDRSAVPKQTITVAIATISLLFTLSWLLAIVNRGNFINQVGFLVGVYAIAMSFYVQLSSRFDHPLAIHSQAKYRVPITLYMIGSSTILYAIRIVNTSANMAPLNANPFASAIANSIIVALVTGWVVHVYLSNLNGDQIDVVDEVDDAVVVDTSRDG